MKYCFFTTTNILIALVLTLSTGAIEKITISSKGNSFAVDVKGEGSLMQISLMDLAKGLDCRIGEDPVSGDPYITSKNHKAVFSHKDFSANVDGKVVSLLINAVKDEGRWWVSYDILKHLWSPVEVSANKDKTHQIKSQKEPEYTPSVKPSVNNTEKSEEAIPPVIFTEKTQALDVIVIDPGHGGSDTGTIGKGGTKEKDLALTISQKLKTKIESTTGIHVVLSREDDRVLGLRERTSIANANNADLFISIHLNSSPSAKTKGTEVYFMNYEATDTSALALARSENEAAQPPEETEHALNVVLWEMAQNAYLSSSQSLAEILQVEFNNLSGQKTRGVKQAPFMVLEGAQMPAVLLEVDFLSNRDSESHLLDPNYQDRIADSIIAAIKQYKDKFYQHGNQSK